jgi:hypothetical protein
MKNLLQDLQAYFKNTPQTKIDSDWDKYSKYDEVGPKVSDLLSHFETHFPYEDNSEVEIEILNEKNKIESPKVSGFFYVYSCYEKSSVLIRNFCFR